MSLRTEPTHRLASPRVDDRSLRTRRRLRAADLLTVACWSSVALAIALFLSSGGVAGVSDAASAITAAGIVTGLVGTDLILVMLVIAARIPLIDRTVGQDKAMAFHRQLGKPALYLILAHGVLLTIGYALTDGTNVIAETISLLQGTDLRARLPRPRPAGHRGGDLGRRSAPTVLVRGLAPGAPAQLRCRARRASRTS